MSEPIPESIPTSADPRSRRPVKKARGPAGAIAQQSAALEALFAKPDREIQIPTTATPTPRTAASLAPPPELVANVQGSSAGAGSGEFHVYKASRRREYERIRLMEAEAKREESDAKWEENLKEKKMQDEQKRNKNAKKRQKARERKEATKRRKGSDGGAAASGDEDGPTKDKEMADNSDAEGTPGITIHEDD